MKKIKEEVGIFYPYELNGGLNKAIAKLTEIRDRYHNNEGLCEKYESFELTYENSPFDLDTCYFVISGIRPENDKEIKKREADEEAAKKWRLKQYKTLKKEFGKNDN